MYNFSFSFIQKLCNHIQKSFISNWHQIIFPYNWTIDFISKYERQLKWSKRTKKQLNIGFSSVICCQKCSKFGHPGLFGMVSKGGFLAREREREMRVKSELWEKRVIFKTKANTVWGAWEQHIPWTVFSRYSCKQFLPIQASKIQA